MAKEVSLSQLLHDSGVRATRPRQIVFDALNNADQPLPISQLVTASKEVDRASVYRTLELFISLGIVEVVHTGWKKSYELAGPFKPHHHHLHCTQCGEIIALDTPELEDLIHRLATSHNYQLTSHHIELSGLCLECRSL